MALVKLQYLLQNSLFEIFRLQQLLFLHWNLNFLGLFWNREKWCACEMICETFFGPLSAIFWIWAPSSYLLSSLVMELVSVVWFNIFLTQQLRRKWSLAGSVNAHHVCFVRQTERRRESSCLISENVAG